jgi:hypothetical protein
MQERVGLGQITRKKGREQREGKGEVLLESMYLDRDKGQGVGLSPKEQQVLEDHTSRCSCKVSLGTSPT